MFKMIKTILKEIETSMKKKQDSTKDKPNLYNKHVERKNTLTEIKSLTVASQKKSKENSLKILNTYPPPNKMRFLK